MKIIFFGNTKYSTIGLRIVNKVYPISLAVTIPKSPVKNLADELKMTVKDSKNSGVVHNIKETVNDVSEIYKTAASYGGKSWK